MAVPSISRDYDTIFTTTWDERRKELQDNIFQSHPLFEKLVKTRVNGSGNRVQIPLRYKKSTTGKQLTSDMDTFTPERKEVATMGDDKWVIGGDSLAIAFADLKRNSGKNKFFNFLNVQIDNLFDSEEERLQVLFWKASPVADQDPNSIPSLFNTAGTGTVHQIVSGTETWWQNQFKSSVGSFATNGRDKMKQLYNLTNKTKQSSMIDCIFTDATGFENFEAILEARERIDIGNSQNDANLGFGGLKWKGAKVYWDPFLATGEGGPSTATDGRWYFLNTKFLHLYVCDGAWMEESPLLEAYDQLAYAKKLWSMFQLMCSARRKFGVMSGVTYP
jgi:hypothetical protein